MTRMILPLLTALAMISATGAYAAQARGTIKSLDMSTNTVTLTDGQVYDLPEAYDMSKLKANEKVVVTYTDPERERLVWSTKGSKPGGHGGGDMATITSFLNACAGRSPAPIKTVQDALSGLVFAASAERSRTSHQMVALADEDFQLDKG